MTEEMNNNESFQEYFDSLKRFVCYRVSSLGWQQAGYVLFSQQLPSSSEGENYPGTAWMEDDAGAYQPGDVIPEEKIPSPAGQKQNDGKNA